MRQDISHLFDELEAIAITPDAASTPSTLESQIAFVQVGLWEVRRRWLTGQTGDLDRLLANLDEDVELLRQALAGEEAVEMTMTS
jgi:hypothetical protein